MSRSPSSPGIFGDLPERTHCHVIQFQGDLVLCGDLDQRLGLAAVNCAMQCQPLPFVGIGIVQQVIAALRMDRQARRPMDAVAGRMVWLYRRKGSA